MHELKLKMQWTLMCYLAMSQLGQVVQSWFKITQG